MITASRADIVRLFPGIQDHAVVDVLATKATVSELEAASLLLGNQNNGLIEAKREAGGQLSRVLDILARAEIVPVDDSDRSVI
jgi:hypothetical protein